MGACCEAEYYIDVYEPKYSITHKVLFLGSSGCGKSTVYKQLSILFGQGFENLVYKDPTRFIADNVTYAIEFVLKSDECKIEESGNEELMAAKNIVIQAVTNTVYQMVLSKELVTSIKLLWDQPEIKALHQQVIYL